MVGPEQSFTGEEDDAVALVRVYCGLASADETVRSASAARLTIAVVDDAGRLLGVHEISDDPGGYAELGMLLVERTSGFTDAAVAADSDDHLVTSLLIAAGRPLVVTDDDTTDDFAERFADDDSVEEMQAPPAARRAAGLARALQAGAIAATNQMAPRELVSYKPVLAAHVALLGGRQATAMALREVLRELYPAALRAFTDPAHPLALAVLDALPEPGRLTAQGDPERVAEQVAAELIRSGAGSDDEIIAAVTALHVAISESPRRGGVNKSLAPAAAETVRKAIAAVRACDAACASLIGTIAARSSTAAGSTRRRAEAAPLQSVPDARLTRRTRRDPISDGSPVIPQPMNAPPTAPDPVAPPPLAPRPVTPPPVAPAAAAAFPNRAPVPGNRPVSVPPPPPGMTPITPGSRPVSGGRSPASAPPPPGFGPASASPAPGFGPSSAPSPGFGPSSAPPPGFGPSSAPPSSAPPSPGFSSPGYPPPSAPLSPAASVSPAESGQPFRATLTNAAINSVRAERQRTVIPPRPGRAAPAPGSATDYSSLPMPAPRPEPSEPGSRANWPMMNPGADDLPVPAASSSISAPPSADTGRVKPPWQDMPKEPPALRLVEPRIGNSLDATVADLPPVGDPPSLRLVEGAARRRNGNNGTISSSGTTLTALDRSTAPPVPSDGSDGDLLIFAAARSAWFTGHTDQTPDMDWANANDSGWQAAERAATPEIAAETPAGLPKRVPQANLVPGSPLRDERPLRIVRDAASIAAHTTGYFRGWRRGQEIGGFAMGGRPGRESAGGWDFTRDREGADDYRNNNDNANSNSR
ncbi:transposase [Paractinoplanes durhamensis]|uniref:transposase n=1 Tax=Paractinoplanes durhamensis TaxID=113563 RepID=UPI001944F82F|nr:transposase [Actinoplanes durhamensis]